MPEKPSETEKTKAEEPHIKEIGGGWILVPPALANRFIPIPELEVPPLSPPRPKRTPETLTPEQAKALFTPFLEETFKNSWGIDQTKIDTIAKKQTPRIIDPRIQNYENLKTDIDPTKFGQYSLNPDTQRVNWETIDPAKLFIVPNIELVGKTRAQVAEYLVQRYGATHHIPGIELWQYILEEKYNAPTVSPALKEKYKQLEDGKWYYFFGSLVRSSGGHWNVPIANRSGSAWYRNASWLAFAWSDNGRVLLLEH